MSNPGPIELDEHARAPPRAHTLTQARPSDPKQGTQEAEHAAHGRAKGAPQSTPEPSTEVAHALAKAPARTHAREHPRDPKGAREAENAASGHAPSGHRRTTRNNARMPT